MCVQALRLLLKHPECRGIWDMPDDKGCTAIWLAARDGQQDVLAVMMEELALQGTEESVCGALEVARAWGHDPLALKVDQV